LLYRIELDLKYLLWITCCLFAFKASAQAVRNFEKKERPKYEFGGGAIGAYLPDYPGAKNNTFRFLPFPYFIYRGDVVRVDDEGSRAKILASKDYEFGLSFSFTFPVDSEDNPSRINMPNLDAVMGLGPQIILRPYKDKKQKLIVNFALRAATSIDHDWVIKNQGWIAASRLRYWRYLTEAKKTILALGLGAELGSKKFNNYYYTVNNDFATPSRPAFEAQAGLVETNISLSLIHSVSQKLSFFGGAFVSDFSNAANRTSPLLEAQTNTGTLLGFFWLFYESDKKVNIYK
jgi:outer membrane protein